MYRLRTMAAQFRARVIQPALGYLGQPYDSPVAVELLLGTALQESGLVRLAQVPVGPALGFWQIEPATHDDLLANFIAARSDLRERLRGLRAFEPSAQQQLATNLAYACAVARLIYYRAPEPLPAAPDPEAMGAYWKAHYNTALGAGTAADFATLYRIVVLNGPV